MRYFFDVSSDRLESRDQEGREFSNQARMQSEARRTLAEIAADESGFQNRSVFTLDVRDAAGRPVYRAVLTLEGQAPSPA